MKAVRSFHFPVAVFAALCLAACSGVQVTHVAPGKSARATVAESEAAQQAITAAAPQDLPVPAANPGPNNRPSEPLPELPAGNVKIPEGTKAAEGVADAYTRGTFAMQAGQNAEAITALEETVKLDPDFTDAWGKLAILYQKEGQSAKATEAFKKAKKLGDANGGTVTRDSPEGLQFP